MTIVVEVSKVPQPVRVPDVVGDKAAAAKQTLEQAGLQFDERKFPGGPDQVLRQTPSAGSVVPRGTTVVIYVF